MICSTNSLRSAVEDLFLADHDLGDAGGVAQVDECDTTVVTAAGDPAGEGDGLSNVLGAKGSQVVCAQHSGPFGRRLVSIWCRRS